MYESAVEEGKAIHLRGRSNGTSTGEVSGVDVGDPNRTVGYKGGTI